MSPYSRFFFAANKHDEVSACWDCNDFLNCRKASKLDMKIPINSSSCLAKRSCSSLRNDQSHQLSQEGEEPIEWTMIELNGEILPPLNGYFSNSTNTTNETSSTVELGLIRLENVSNHSTKVENRLISACSSFLQH